MDKWYDENHVVLNFGKCHYLLIGNKSHGYEIISADLKSNDEKPTTSVPRQLA